MVNLFVKVTRGVESIEKAASVIAVVGEFRLCDAEMPVRVKELSLELCGFHFVGVSGKVHVGFVNTVVV